VAMMEQEEDWFVRGGDVTVEMAGVGGTGNLHDRRGAASSSTSSSSSGLENKIAYEVANQVFKQAQSRAGGLFNIYAHLDLIKPYFDVELSTVVRRLRASFVPRGFFGGSSGSLPSTAADVAGEGSQVDLYGPTMLVFTLVAVLLLGMKLSHTTVHEGTLVGSAFGVCFTYWLVLSLGMRFMAYLLGMQLTVLDALSYAGYGLLGYCLALLTHYVFNYTLPLLSTVALIGFGGASALTLAGLFWQELHQRDKAKALTAAIGVGSVHFLFLLYIRFFYASLYNAAVAAF